jgi:P27 family predicted phage terminase small subunit
VILGEVLMPQPRIPIPLKLLRGNPGKQRLGPPFEPERLPVAPDPPPFLGTYAMEEWRRVAPGLHQLCLLSTFDIMPFAAYCLAYARWREAQEELAQESLLMPVKEGHVRRNPLTVIAHEAAADKLKFASEFGMTPAARARISAGIGRAQANKFDGLIES